MAATKTLQSLMDRAASWPDEAQAELVRFMIDIEAKHFGVFRLDDEDCARIERSLAAADRGELATDEEVAAVFARYRGR
jgi:predicted transcriptional regulator